MNITLAYTGQFTKRNTHETFAKKYTRKIFAPNETIQTGSMCTLNETMQTNGSRWWVGYWKIPEVRKISGPFLSPVSCHNIMLILSKTARLSKLEMFCIAVFKNNWKYTFRLLPLGS